MFDAITNSYVGSIGRKSGVDQYTKLLLHMNGEENGTDFPDSGVTEHIITPVDNAKTKIGLKKFGTSSCVFDSAGDYLSALDHADWDFGTDPFTIDFWWRTTDNTMSRNYVQQHVDNDDYWEWYFTPTSFTFRNYVGGTSTIIQISDPFSALTESVWYHLALIRGWGGDADTYMFTINGTGTGMATFTDTSEVSNHAAPLTIGTYRATGVGMLGHMDEFRISKGIARWTTDFQPPIRPY